MAYGKPLIRLIRLIDQSNESNLIHFSPRESNIENTTRDRPLFATPPSVARREKKFCVVHKYSWIPGARCWGQQRALKCPPARGRERRGGRINSNSTSYISKASSFIFDRRAHRRNVNRAETKRQSTLSRARYPDAAWRASRRAQAGNAYGLRHVDILIRSSRYKKSKLRSAWFCEK